ncbi:MAG: 3-ketoacyl-CoA thiolase [Bacteroidota bacterium]|nr:3-ketoacyl-CoA thiolase [Bacteroidota bacterium]
MKLRKKVYLTAGYNTISLGTGRKEFHPKKERPGIEHYIKEAGQGVLKQIGGAKNVDESVFGNFMAARFNKQGNLAAFAPFIDEGLRYKPSNRVEGACGSGALALTTAFKSVLADTADVVLSLGFEVQNTYKAIYGADLLSLAGWQGMRKDGHAFFFPGQFSDRAGDYYQKYGYDYARKGFARWYRNAIENARLDPTAQEHHNSVADLEAQYTNARPNGKAFVDNLNVFDCSKVSDAASAIAVASEEGLKKMGISKENAVEIVSFGQATNDITKAPDNLSEMDGYKAAAQEALKDAGLTINDIGTIETHDCFTIAGIIGVEMLGLAEAGKGAQFVADGKTARDGYMPMNTTGGLIGWGHPTGGTGVHMAVTLWQQLTGKAGNAQINIDSKRPYGMSINMGGDDKTLTAIIYKKAE